MRVAHVHDFHLDKSEQKTKSETLKLDIKPILYLEDLGLFEDEKEFYRFIIRLKYMIRKSREYSELMKFLKEKGGMDHCGVHPNIKWKDGFAIHIHHTPLVLEDIIHIVIAKRQKKYESLTMTAIAKEVMELHYLGLFGLYPLCETCHEYAHGDANDLFIPLDAVKGDVETFFDIYQDYISDSIKVKFHNIQELSRGYQIIQNEIPEGLMRKYVYVELEGSQQLPSTTALVSFINDLSAK